jgi:amino acid adenylation domain-containing protein
MTIFRAPEAVDRDSLVLGERRPYPRDATVHALFGEHAARTPDAVAVSAPGRLLTYGDLDRAADRLAAVLASHEAGPGAYVALVAGRGIDALVGILATLKTGAAYLPLDPSEPPTRSRTILEDARPAVLLTEKQFLGRFSATGAKVVPLEVDTERASTNRPVDAARRASSPLDPAYLMYTSGSTGAPKGVIVPHRAIVRLVVNTDFVQLDESEVMLQMAPMTFDASTFEIWGALLNGGRLALMPTGMPSLRDIAEVVAEHEVTTVWLPASLFRQVAEEDPRILAGIRQLVTGGDVVDPTAVRRVLATVPGLTVVNGYGPTEATTFSCAHPLRAGDPVGDPLPIGRPIANTSVYIVASDSSLVPRGTSGELWVGGDGLALGYLNDSEATTAAFAQDRYSNESGARLYRTGDRARLLPDGSIEFLGRIDRQVKVRGYRVELGEVDAVVADHPRVGASFSLTRAASRADRYIVTYVSPRRETEDAPSPAASREAEVVRQWRRVYEDVVYDDLSSAPNPELNTTGWKSSYTGLPLTADEMREQVEQAAERILEHAPRDVLEIGCGTGMLLNRLAPHCRHYVGTDFSDVALAWLRGQLHEKPLPCRTTLIQAEAHDLSPVDGKRFDVVVLNSVVQHFPSAAYLHRVLAQILPLLRKGGRVFLGDLRSKALLRAFHASVEWSRADPSLSMRRLCSLIEQKVRDERELVVDPEFFETAGLPGVTGVRAELKRGGIANELTCFRYDVVLETNPPAETQVVPTFEWCHGSRPTAAVARLLAAERPEALAVPRIPNRRCALERWLLSSLDLPWEAETVGEVKATVPDDFTAGLVDPEELRAVAAANGYRAELHWSRGDIDGSFDALLTRRDRYPDGALGVGSVQAGSWEEHTNDPLVGFRRLALARELRAHVHERLPSYMAPAFFVVLDALPMTSAGKVDVANLPDATLEGRERGGRPLDSTSAKLAALWEDILDVDGIQDHESFFELGGNSLLAIQLVNRIEAIFGVRLSPVQVFERPTLGGLATLLQPGALESAWLTQAEASGRRGQRRRALIRTRADRGPAE